MKLISFEEIRMPSMQTNERLHDMRQLLASLKRGVQETNTYIPAGLAHYYDRVPEIANRHHAAHLSPVANFQQILEDVAKLETLLMETFQLLMSSLSIQDSQTSIRHSRRGTLLTVLACIYIPLSFVTGIFGMNIKEVNGSPLNIWVCFVTLGVVVVSNVLGFAIYWLAHTRNRQIAKESSSRTSWSIVDVSLEFVGVFLVMPFNRCFRYLWKVAYSALNCVGRTKKEVNTPGCDKNRGGTGTIKRNRAIHTDQEERLADMV